MKTRFLLWLMVGMTGFVERLRAEPSAAVVVERGPHHLVFQRVTDVTLPDGRVLQETSAYTQLGTAICYWKDGAWHESNPRFSLFPGGAIAQEGQFQLIISPDVAAEGAVDLLTPDSKRIRCSPRWLAYYNRANGRSELIAAVKSCAGQMVDERTILFPDAFDDIHAAIRYSCQPWGMEQEIILLDPDPLTPGRWGFKGHDPDDIVLEMWSEFHESPQPDNVTPSVLHGRRDVTLDFGRALIGSGKAFSLGDEEDGIPVTKTWTKVERRQFLIEAVSQPDLASLLAKLPKRAEAANPAHRPRRLVQGAPVNGRAGLLAQGQERLRSRERRTQTASIAPNGAQLKNGVSLDFAITTTASNMVLEAGKTYLATNDVIFSGTTRIEGGAVVKFSNVTNSTTARLTFTGPIDCQTDRYRPAVFTGKDDDSIGDIIAGSSGIPGTNRYAKRVFDFGSAASPYDLHDVHIRFADQAFGSSSVGVAYTVRHSQIGRVNWAFYNGSAPATACARNVLVSDAVTAVFNAAPSCTNVFEHLTFHGVRDFRDASLTGVVIATNSLLICVTNHAWFQASNCVANSLSDAGVFAAVGAGLHYLANGSPYRNGGSTNINPALAADLKSRTTTPPIVLGTDVAIDTVLSPQAQRESSIPDLGYAYEPLDYVLSQRLLTNAALVLTNGVALGVYGANGLRLAGGSKLISTGAADKLNRICPYYMVQECPTNWGSSLLSALAFDGSITTNYPEVDLRFTDVPLLNQGVITPKFIATGYAGPTRLLLRDCRLLGGSLMLIPHQSTLTQISVGLTNNTFEACSWRFNMGYSSDKTPVHLHLRNNLFYRGSLVLTIEDPMVPWSVHDNLFYSNTLTTPAAQVTNSHNGYYLTAPLAGTWGDNRTLASASFENGWLGRFYYPTNGGAGGLSDLVNAGSRNATNAGLYHFTTATNQTKEASSTVDIGFHHAAVNSAGKPLDGDGDGVPDYWEDANGNGNGTAGSGETDWRTYTSPLGSTGAPGLQVFTPLE